MKAWDIPYLSEKLQQQLYSISEEELRPYFPAPKVIQGMFDTVSYTHLDVYKRQIFLTQEISEK